MFFLIKENMENGDLIGEKFREFKFIICFIYYFIKEKRKYMMLYMILLFFLFMLLNIILRG